jgi:ABC-2 type transport system ATP-binding protein
MTSPATIAPRAPRSGWCRRSSPPTPSRGLGHGPSFSRGLFGKPREPGAYRAVLRDLSLWDKRDSKIMALSGGMKRRVMIAKALSHEPEILFLDEPTAGRRCRAAPRHVGDGPRLRDKGVTIILTTHYIEEAEEMADRVGVIDKGEMILVEDKTPDAQARPKTLTCTSRRRSIARLPAGLADYQLSPTTAPSWIYDASTARPEHEERASPPLLRRLATRASTSRISTPSKARSRTSSSAW